MSDYGSGFVFDDGGNPVSNANNDLLPDPSTIYANNDGSFGNNGDSTSSTDNLSTGGGPNIGDVPVDENAALNNFMAPGSGAPTAADVQSLKDEGYTDEQIAQTFGNIAAEKPEWASGLSKLLGGITLPKTNLPASAFQKNPDGTTTIKPPGSGPGTGGGNGGGGGGQGLGTTDMMGLLAAGGLAAQQFNNANQYTKQAEQYAGVLNPYGAYRDAAAQKLAALQADPSSIVNTPGYQFNLSQGLGAVANRDNRSFGVGAGSTNPDMMNFASGLASKTYNDTINQYSQQAGVNIGPQSAASILQAGMQGNIASQNNAINALMSPFGPGNNTGGAGGSSGGGIDWSKIFGGNANPFPTSSDPTNPTGTGIDPTDPTKSGALNTQGNEETGGQPLVTPDSGYGSY